MIYKIDKPYVWLPVSKTAPVQKLEFYSENKKIQEIDLRLGTGACDFYGCWDARKYLGQEILIKGTDEEALSGILTSDKKYENDYAFRPKLHFAPEAGWHNDPNGMVFSDGVYHLYYQWNPYGTEWGNLHWGHVSSRDLAHWKQEPAAMEPDERGLMFSGCGYEDKENRMGYGNNSLLFFYTAAGGLNEWSKDAGNLFTQRLAYSTDGGRTLQASDKFLMPWVAGENRDPKVFYHEESGAYIMVLFLDHYEFAVYRSDDLRSWTETQRLSVPGMWECPDLFRLDVKDRDGHLTGEKKWVFWSADGYYLTGEFDGYTFSPEGKRKMAYSSVLPYAAQTFSGISGGRVISMAWLRMENDRGNYRGLMSLPTELSLEKEKEDYYICFSPASEIEELPVKWSSEPADSILPQGRAVQYRLKASGQTEGEWKLHIENLKMTIDFSNGLIAVEDTMSHTWYVKERFEPDQEQEFQIIFDQEVIEIFGSRGRLYGTAETPENILGKKWTIERTPELYIQEKTGYYL